MLLVDRDLVVLEIPAAAVGTEGVTVECSNQSEAKVEREEVEKDAGGFLEK